MHELVLAQACHVGVHGLIPDGYLVEEPALELHGVFVVVHLLDNSSPHPLFNDSSLHSVFHQVDVAKLRCAETFGRVLTTSTELSGWAHLLDLIQHPTYFSLTFEGEPVAEEHTEKVLESVLDVHLNEAEFLVTFVFENLAEQPDVVIIVLVRMNAVDDGDEPLNNQILESILLVQVSVYVLLHGLPRLLAILALLVELDLLTVDVEYGVPQLLDTQLPIRYLTELGHHGAGWRTTHVNS